MVELIIGICLIFISFASIFLLSGEHVLKQMGMVFILLVLGVILSFSGIEEGLHTTSKYYAVDMTMEQEQELVRVSEDYNIDKLSFNTMYNGITEIKITTKIGDAGDKRNLVDSVDFKIYYDRGSIQRSCK